MPDNLDAFVSRISEPVQVEPSPPPSTDPTIMTPQPTEAEPPLEVWAQVKGMPYTAKYFDVSVWNKHTESDVKAVDGYILNEVVKKGLEPTVASYNEIMDEISSFLQLSPNIARNVRFEKVVDYVKLFLKYQKIEEQHKQFIHEASQLREIEYG